MSFETYVPAFMQQSKDAQPKLVAAKHTLEPGQIICQPLNEVRKREIQAGSVLTENEKQQTAVEAAGLFLFSKKKRVIYLGKRTERKFKKEEVESIAGKADSEDLEGCTTVEECLVNTAIREAAEEMGIQLTPKLLFDAPHIDSIGNTGGLVRTFLINVDDQDGIVDALVDSATLIAKNVEQIVKALPAGLQPTDKAFWTPIKEKFPLSDIVSVSFDSLLAYIADLENFLDLDSNHTIKKFATLQNPYHLVKVTSLVSNKSEELMIRWFNVIFMCKQEFKDFIKK